MKAMFLRTCYEKVHWIGTLLNVENVDAISSLNYKVCQHLKILSLILNIGDFDHNAVSSSSQLESIDVAAFRSDSALELCHSEMTRLKYIFKFLGSHQHFGSFDNKMQVKKNIMNSLAILQVDFSMENYEAILNLLSLNQEINERQFEMTEAEPRKIKSEVELLNEYMVIKLYLNIIQSNDSMPNMIKESLNHIRTLIRTVNDGKTLYQLMQNVFTLIFLRFEHIRKTKRKRKNSEKQSGSISNQNNSHTTDVSDAATVESLQTGFVCLKSSLEIVLNSMRLCIMGLDQLKCYQTCDSDLKTKFEQLLNNVDNALWRLTIIDNENHKKFESSQNVKEWIISHENHRSNMALTVTSDEDKITPKKKVYRKKLKKRQKIAVKSDENDEASDEANEFQLLTETSVTEISGNRANSRSTELQRRVKSIISKLLVDPESLVTTCMLKGDLQSIEKVIQVSWKTLVLKTH